LPAHQQGRLNDLDEERPGGRDELPLAVVGRLEAAEEGSDILQSARACA
jgi:hypothetical protein